MPKESEKDGAPSLTLSRLQLLGVGLTYSTQKHHRVTRQVMELQQDNMENTVESCTFHMDGVRTGDKLRMISRLSCVRNTFWPAGGKPQ